MSAGAARGVARVRVCRRVAGRSLLLVSVLGVAPVAAPAQWRTVPIGAVPGTSVPPGIGAVPGTAGRAGAARAPGAMPVTDAAIARVLAPALVAVVVMPIDARVTRWVSAPPIVDAPGVGAIAATGRVSGGIGALGLGPVTWLAGEAGADRALARTGARTTGAVLVALAATGAIKVLAGRTRPDASAEGSAHHWRPGSGLRGDAWRSFPSGHASLATAAAVTVAHGLRTAGSAGWRDGAAIGAYALAGTAIVSRVRDRRHWLSDVLAGAALGSASALVARRW